MAKTRRANKIKNRKAKSRARHVKGGMLKAAVGLAALASQTRPLNIGSAIAMPYSSALASYTPATMPSAAATAPLVASSTPMFTDAKGSSISREEGEARIAAWKAEVEAASAKPSNSANNVCAAPIPAPVCDGNIGIPRNLMPQIKRSARGSFLAFVKKWTGNNNVVTDEIMDARELQPTQRELMASGIEKITKKMNKGNVNPNPIIVARNPLGETKVVDGHHRWAAIVQSTSPLSKDMGVTVLNISIEEALEAAAAWGAPREEEKS